MDVANTLVKHVREGSATQSPWPYRVIMDSGKITSEFGANWSGAYMLFDNLIKAKHWQYYSFQGCACKNCQVYC